MAPSKNIRNQIEHVVVFPTFGTAVNKVVFYAVGQHPAPPVDLISGSKRNLREVLTIKVSLKAIF